jgi:hypothetical protein
MIALIGRGTVGHALLAQRDFDCVFDSSNIDTMLANHFESVVIAAPSGNRRTVNQNSAQDDRDVEQIVEAIRRVRPPRCILFSSVDAVVSPHTAYGHNRKFLEQSLAGLTELTVFRLSTLIGDTIKKNILYDIKHQQHTHEIDTGAWLQWCLLEDLSRLVDWAQPGQAVNIVSEPIQNQELMQKFCSGVNSSYATHSVNYNLEPWCYTKQQIFEAMEFYLQ